MGADVEVVAPKAGKNEVLFPVALPDQGVFDWLDQTMEENPSYVEISDRSLAAWAVKSGLHKPRGQPWSNDKPGINFGIASMDDSSAKKALMAVAPAQKRDFVCMELNANLQAAERARALKRFPASDFKRVAVVVMGEPTSSYKERIHKMLLAEKVETVTREKEKLAEEEARKKRNQEREQSRKRKAEGEEADKEAENGEAKEGGEKQDEAKKEEAKEEEKPIELTEEEKATVFRKLPSPDITASTVTKCFANYSIPTKEEGFDEIRYVWSKADVCQTKFKEWLLQNKKTQRIEDLEPSAWFKEKWSAWEKTLAEWTETHKNPKKAKAARQAEKEKENAEGGENAEGKDDAE